MTQKCVLHNKIKKKRKKKKNQVFFSFLDNDINILYSK